MRLCAMSNASINQRMQATMPAIHLSLMAKVIIFIFFLGIYVYRSSFVPKFLIDDSGLIAPGAKNLIGNGTVVHIPQFFKELNEMKEKGINTDGRIFVSDRAHVLFQLRKLHHRISFCCQQCCCMGLSKADRSKPQTSRSMVYVRRRWAISRLEPPVGRHGTHYSFMTMAI